MKAARLLSIAVASALVTTAAGCASSGSSDADSDLKSEFTGQIACGLSNGKDATGSPINPQAIK